MQPHFEENDLSRNSRHEGLTALLFKEIPASFVF
jgi:hypothetical protein